MNSVAGLKWVELVTILALIEYSVLGAMVGRSRVKYGVEAPAVTGNPIFERYFRVHQNTLESLVVFLPAMWLFAFTVNAIAAAVVGLIFLVARLVYMRGYVEEPKRRALGAAATFLTNTALVIGSLVGLLVHW